MYIYMCVSVFEYTYLFLEENIDQKSWFRYNNARHPSWVNVAYNVVSVTVPCKPCAISNLIIS